VTRMRDKKLGMTLEVRDLGRMPYARALAIQREINLAVSRGAFVPDVPRGASVGGASGGGASVGNASGGGADGCLLLVEHDPVITVTHRQGAWDNLLAPAQQLDEMGIAVEITDRGGDITYHGPGQLVVYPILKLNPLGLNLSTYMRLLEQVVIDTLQTFNITGQRDPDATGVWVAPGSKPTPGSKHIPASNPPLAKLCAMGVRVRKNTTMHGLALNVTTNLDHFKTIDPCGLGGRPVTSLRELLGDDLPTMEVVKAALVKQLQSAINALVSGVQ
jgi:lipoyl(octanoyl) transferase